MRDSGRGGGMLPFVAASEVMVTMGPPRGKGGGGAGRTTAAGISTADACEASGARPNPEMSDQLASMVTGDRSLGGWRFPWLMLRATSSKSCDARFVLKAYSPSPPGHFLPASKEKTFPSQPYLRRNLRGHSSCSWVLLFV